MLSRSLLFPSLLVAAACAFFHDDPSVTASMRVGDSVTLAISETALVEDAGIRITFEEVLSDSRCPTDAFCVQAGDAQVRLRGARQGMPTTRADVGLFDHTSLTYAGVAFYLERLDPWPVSTGGTTPTNRYRATIGTRALVAG